MSRVADVRDLDAMYEVVADGVARFGSVDAVVANAGIGSRARRPPSRRHAAPPAVARPPRGCPSGGSSRRWVASWRDRRCAGTARNWRRSRSGHRSGRAPCTATGCGCAAAGRRRARRARSRPRSPARAGPGRCRRSRCGPALWRHRHGTGHRLWADGRPRASAHRGRDGDRRTVRGGSGDQIEELLSRLPGQVGPGGDGELGAAVPRSTRHRHWWKLTTRSGGASAVRSMR